MTSEQLRFNHEQPVPRILAFLVIGLFALLAAAAGSAAFVMFDASEMLWGIIAGLLAVAMLGLCIAAFVKYYVRGTRGHYIRIRRDLLETGEMDGRVQHSIPIDAIVKTEYVEEVGYRIKVFTSAGSFVFNEVELLREIYDRLEAELLSINPAITVYDNSTRTHAGSA